MRKVLGALAVILVATACGSPTEPVPLEISAGRFEVRTTGGEYDLTVEGIATIRCFDGGIFIDGEAGELAWRFPDPEVLVEGRRDLVDSPTAVLSAGVVAGPVVDLGQHRAVEWFVDSVSDEDGESVGHVTIERSGPDEIRGEIHFEGRLRLVVGGSLEDGGTAEVTGRFRTVGCLGIP